MDFWAFIFSFFVAIAAFIQSALAPSMPAPHVVATVQPIPSSAPTSLPPDLLPAIPINFSFSCSWTFNGELRSANLTMPLLLDGSYPRQDEVHRFCKDSLFPGWDVTPTSTPVSMSRFADYYADLTGIPLKRLYNENQSICFEDIRGCYPKGCYIGESTLFGLRLVFIKDDCMNVAGGAYSHTLDFIIARADMSGNMQYGTWVIWHEFGHHIGIKMTTPADYTEEFADNIANAHQGDAIKP
jgi:hypothetical protein